MSGEALVTRLAAIAGHEHVLAAPELRAGAETDWTGRWHGRASAVVRPASRGQAAEVVAACAEAGVAVVAQGGNTGLVGGAVPRDGAVVLSTARLDGLGAVDPRTARVTVGAGATLAAVQRQAAGHGLAVGVDLASRATATIGGMVATNAGGVHVVAHGMMRAQVAGLAAVLADGSLLDERRGPDKDNTGYDLVGLLIGSEGTLGVVTDVTLRLVGQPTHRAVAVVPRVALADAVAALPALRAAPGLAAVEWVDADTAALVAAHGGLARPVGHGPWLLVELAGHADPTEALATALADVAGAERAAVGVEPGERAALWAHREAATDAIAAEATRGGRAAHKLDVTVPLASLADTAGRVRRAVAAVAPAARVALFGHLADGNLHVQLLDLDPEHAEAAEDAVLGEVVAAGGSISAEHGIGVAKRRWLARARSPASVAAMRAVKRAFDPQARLNPGVLVDP